MISVSRRHELEGALKHGDAVMMIDFTYDRQVVQLVKQNDHFVVVYPNTPTGRIEAREAVRDWLLDCELDFDRQDAEVLWKAIDVSRFQTTVARLPERDVRWRRRRL
jgi:hypothetical protein